MTLHTRFPAKKCSLLLWLVLLGFVAKNHAQTRENILLARIWLDGRTMLDLQNAGLEADHGFYEPNQWFRSEFSASELRRVHAAGFRIDTLEADVQARFLRENATRRPVRTPSADRGASVCDAFGAIAGTPNNYTYGSLSGYYTYAEYLAVLDDMRAKFPHLISARTLVNDTLRTHEGRPLWFVRISDQPDADEADEAEALYTALHHAREPNSMTHLIYFMWHLLENYDSDPALRYLLNHTELYFIPCLNPDGYIFNEINEPLGGGYWRKNRRDNGNGSFGVDLNRNYGHAWGDPNGASNDPNSEVYHGPSAFSEPETRMLKYFADAHQMEIALNCHTSGNKLVHPWTHFDEVPTPDFTDLADWLTRENNYFAGTCYQTLGYLASGSSDDWWYADKGVLAYTPETGSGFWPWIDQIEGNNRGMLLTNLSAAWYALGGAVIRHLPGEVWTGNTLNVPFEVVQHELGDGQPIQLTFEAVTPNIQTLSAPTTLFLNGFESAQVAVQVVLNASVQPGDIIQFVAKTERAGQVHSDTFSTVFEAQPFVLAFSENHESADNQWVANNGWGLTTEQAYSPSRSMTDSPFDVYTAEENTVSTALPINIPGNATEARLRFFTRWDIQPGLDRAQLLISTESSPPVPLAGTLSTIHPLLSEPVYNGSQWFWEEECVDLQGYIGQHVFLHFALYAPSGNPNAYDGFYFDDLVLEYQANGGVSTIEIADDWVLESHPNPAASQTVLQWETASALGQDQRVEIHRSGWPFQQITLAAGQAKALTVETAHWPTGVYFYRLVGDSGSSPWKKLVVLH